MFWAPGWRKNLAVQLVLKKFNTLKGKYMSKKYTVAALALALAGLAAAPIAHSADAPANPTGAEQKSPCAPKKDAGNPCGPAKKKAANPCGPSNPCGPKKRKSAD